MRVALLIIIFTLPLSALVNSEAISVGEYHIEYEVKGSGEATLFLEAGGSAGMQDWDSIYDDLVKYARVIRYSRVGNGKSTAIKKHFSSEDYAQGAKALLEVLGVKGKVTYIAHSYGAHVARTFAAQYPEKIAALMLIEPSSEHDVDIMRSLNLELAEKQIAQVKLDDMKNGMSNQYLDFWSKRPLSDYPKIPDIPVTVIASIKKYDNPPLLFFTDEARDMWGELHSNWAKAFPRGKAVLTEKSYHYPQNDEPEMIVKEVLALISRGYK
ncbi:alpha/beta hydrolase [uncultured Microbulbifer sp.]|uniref:alpha/beta fold hydrolase n=1 Tax=uncultured Microbulbifer sp. TaxID=348147 RepID=UPI0026086A11|nr:alpha/beta hydrolase [uncultured Microbulbifer sp.]